MDMLAFNTLAKIFAWDQYLSQTQIEYAFTKVAETAPTQSTERKLDTLQFGLALSIIAQAIEEKAWRIKCAVEMRTRFRYEYADAQKLRNTNDAATSLLKFFKQIGINSDAYVAPAHLIIDPSRKKMLARVDSPKLKRGPKGLSRTAETQPRIYPQPVPSHPNCQHSTPSRLGGQRPTPSRPSGQLSSTPSCPGSRISNPSSWGDEDSIPPLSTHYASTIPPSDDQNPSMDNEIATHNPVQVSLPVDVASHAQATVRGVIQINDAVNSRPPPTIHPHPPVRRLPSIYQRFVRRLKVRKDVASSSTSCSESSSTRNSETYAGGRIFARRQSKARSSENHPKLWRPVERDSTSESGLSSNLDSRNRAISSDIPSGVRAQSRTPSSEIMFIPSMNTGRGLTEKFGMYRNHYSGKNIIARKASQNVESSSTAPRTESSLLHSVRRSNVQNRRLKGILDIMPKS